MTYPMPKQPVLRIPPEQMQGSFLKIALPNMEQLRPIYGRMAMLACMQSIEQMAKTYLGDSTVVWLHKAAVVQVHKSHSSVVESVDAIEQFYDALSEGLTLNMDGAKIELHWADRPLMAVVEQNSEKLIGNRFAQADQMLEAMEGGAVNWTDPKRRILMAKSFQTPSDRLRDQANDWRRQQVLQNALINQEINLTFREVRATTTDTLIGYTASPEPIPAPTNEANDPPIDAQQMWALARRSRASSELAMTLIRATLNQLRIWQVLVPANDITLTIDVEVDTIIENQDAIGRMLKEYSDVSDKLIIALKLDDDCKAFKEQELTGATIEDLHQFAGTRFAFSDMGFGEGKRRLAQMFGAQVAHLAPQWGASHDFFTKAKPIIRSLTRVLHMMRSEVVATNMPSNKTNTQLLEDLGVDAYEVRPADDAKPLTANDAICQIRNHQQSIAGTVINARFRFRQTT